MNGVVEFGRAESKSLPQKSRFKKNSMQKSLQLLNNAHPTRICWAYCQEHTAEHWDQDHQVFSCSWKATARFCFFLPHVSCDSFVVAFLFPGIIMLADKIILIVKCYFSEGWGSEWCVCTTGVFCWKGSSPLSRETLVLSPCDITCNFTLSVWLLLWNLICFIGGAKTNILHVNIDVVL